MNLFIYSSLFILLAMRLAVWVLPQILLSDCVLGLLLNEIFDNTVYVQFQHLSSNRK